jgi:hypothetical protein
VGGAGRKGNALGGAGKQARQCHGWGRQAGKARQGNAMGGAGRQARQGNAMGVSVFFLGAAPSIFIFHLYEDVIEIILRCVL